MTNTSGSAIIKINGVEYKINTSFRGIMLFEEMTGLKIAEMPETTTNMLKLFYCILKACNPEKFNYTFDQFIDMIDNDSTSFETFNEFLLQLNNSGNAGNNTQKKSSQVNP